VRLLLDQNLSTRLVPMLSDLFPGSAHVGPLGLAEADDEAIWAYAARHGFAIISKDSDFHQRSFLRGAPPKVIWIRLGNCTTASIETVLRHAQEALAAFERDEAAAFLILE
jgi:predicted nuclease of predicted toxin-antitoxin system